MWKLCIRYLEKIYLYLAEKYNTLVTQPKLQRWYNLKYIVKTYKIKFYIYAKNFSLYLIVSKYSSVFILFHLNLFEYNYANFLCNSYLYVLKWNAICLKFKQIIIIVLPSYPNGVYTLCAYTPPLHIFDAQILSKLSPWARNHHLWHVQTVLHLLFCKSILVNIM